MLQCGHGNFPSASLVGTIDDLAEVLLSTGTAAGRPSALGKIPRRPCDPTTWVRGGWSSGCVRSFEGRLGMESKLEDRIEASFMPLMGIGRKSGNWSCLVAVPWED